MDGLDSRNPRLLSPQVICREKFGMLFDPKDLLFLPLLPRQEHSDLKDLFCTPSPVESDRSRSGSRRRVSETAGGPSVVSSASAQWSWYWHVWWFRRRRGEEEVPDRTLAPCPIPPRVVRRDTSSVNPFDPRSVPGPPLGVQRTRRVQPQSKVTEKGGNRVGRFRSTEDSYD